MKRDVRVLGAILTAIAGLVLVTGILGAKRRAGGTSEAQEGVSLHESLLATSEEDKQLPTPPRPARRWNLEQIGFHDLGGGGWNADVWAHGDYAYVGSWGGNAFCPFVSRGTKVIDISDPANPVQVNTLPGPSRTKLVDVTVAHIETAFFQGDLLVVSNEECRSRGARGIEIWDVTDPPNAELLGSFGPRRVSSNTFYEWGVGVHNLYLYQKGDRAFVLIATVRAESRQIEFDPPATGDLKIVEVTNPREPVQIASWGIKQDLGEPVGRMLRNGTFIGDDCSPVCRGEADAVIILHDVWANQEGTVAYLSYWDAGLILLDISDPSQPRFLGRGTYDLSDEGNTHSAVPAQGGNLVIVGDEDLVEDPWGFMRVFDTTDATNPVEVGQFHTEHTFGPSPDAGIYTAHNFVVRGATVYASWASDGVRLLDISAPAAPREIASFVPPDVPDPRGILVAKTVVWGIYVQGDLIFASDTNAGLYILKRRRMNISPGNPGNRVELGSQETVVVAILGSAEFDVTQLDVQSLAFGPDGAAPIAGTPEDPFPSVEDVNEDGFDDLVVLFEVAETGVALGDTEVCVTGETDSEVSLAECDSVEVVVQRRRWRWR